MVHGDDAYGVEVIDFLSLIEVNTSLIVRDYLSPFHHDCSLALKAFLSAASCVILGVSYNWVKTR